MDVPRVSVCRQYFNKTVRGYSGPGSQTNPNQSVTGSQSFGVSFTGCPARPIKKSGDDLVRKISGRVSKWAQRRKPSWQDLLKPPQASKAPTVSAQKRANERWFSRFLPEKPPESYEASVPKQLRGMSLRQYLSECARNFYSTIRNLDPVPGNGYTVYCWPLSRGKQSSCLILNESKPFNEALGELERYSQDFRKRLPELNKNRQGEKQYLDFFLQYHDLSEIKSSIESLKSLGQVKVKGILGMGTQCIAFVTHDNRVIKLSTRQIVPTTQQFLKGVDFPYENHFKIPSLHPGKPTYYAVIQPLGRDGLTHKMPERRFEKILNKINKTLSRREGKYEIVYDLDLNDLGSRRNLSSFRGPDGKERYYVLDADCIGYKKGEAEAGLRDGFAYDNILAQFDDLLEGLI